MAAISELLHGCLAEFISLINSCALSNHTEEVPLQEWTDELGRLRIWAANIGAHQTRLSSLDYRLRDASHIKSQIVRLLERFQELLTDLKDVLEEENDDEAQDDGFEDLGDISESEDSTEIQEIHQCLVETINQLYQMSMIIRKPAQHDRLVGTKKSDSEPFQFWAKQHTSNKYPNADTLVIDRISSAMARQRAILKYRERHHDKLSQGIDPENDDKSTMLSETVVTDVFKEMPGQFSDMVSDTGMSETSYGGTLLEGTGADAPKIPPIPKSGTEQRPFECPYCFYIITARDRRAWARHIFHDLMPYVCIFPGCSTPNKLYGSRRQWHHHVQQTHDVKSSTDGTYDCSICNQGSLPAASFQRHVGQHLEELALFLLPRTNSDEDENAVPDENLSNASLHYSVEHSVEDVNNTTTSAFKSDPDDYNRLGGMQNKSKHYPSSIETNLSDRESPGDLKSNMEDKIHTSSPPYNRDYDIAVGWRVKDNSDLQQEIELRKQQQDIEHLGQELEKHRDRLRRLERYELKQPQIMSLLDLKKSKEADKDTAEHDDTKIKMREEMAKQQEQEERDNLKKEILDEERREAAEAEEKSKRELLMKAAAVKEWNLEQERIKQKQKQEAAERNKEFREHRLEMGHTKEEIEAILHKKKPDKKDKEKEKRKEHEPQEENTTWIKV